MADKSKRTIYVGGLPSDVNEASLTSLFSVFGEVVEVHLPREGGKDASVSSPHRGFAFVILATSEAAEDAIDNMHLNEFDGKILNVNFARPIGATLNSNKPIWQDEEWIAQHGTSLTRQEDAPQAEVEPVPTTGAEETQ